MIIKLRVVIVFLLAVLALIVAKEDGESLFYPDLPITSTAVVENNKF